MKWPWSRAETKTDMSLDQLLQRLDDAFKTTSGVSVTPENCMQSPTVNAIVTAVSRRISVSPIMVMKRTVKAGREFKEPLPDHPVTKLLNRPNDFQTKTAYWLDSSSSLMRYGKYFAYKARGQTGPIRRLLPLHAGAVSIEQDDDFDVTYRVTQVRGQQRVLSTDEVHYVRGAARDFLNGDSTVSDVREAIALEIAMERAGASIFGNGVMPLLVFKFMQGFKNFATKAEEDSFLASVKQTLGGNKRHSSFIVPKGMEMDATSIDNEKAQYIDSRKYQRTVIAGAFGVPPHFVGDLERATFNNVEQQDTDFIINVVLPQAKIFESAMEKDLLTDADRSGGVIIRFNLDAIQRADFKSRQEGLQIQRQNGIINANEWREADNRNPISDEDDGDAFIRPANFVVAGEEPEDEPAIPNRPAGTEEPPKPGD